MNETDLLTVKEAAARYNPRMRVATFREKILPILIERGGTRIRTVVRRVIKIYPAAVDALIEEERGKVG